MENLFYSLPFLDNYRPERLTRKEEACGRSEDFLLYVSPWEKLIMDGGLPRALATALGEE